jgi:mannose-6-phosphate isomerase-like protein (cupin superfamily)
MPRSGGGAFIYGRDEKMIVERAGFVEKPWGSELWVAVTEEYCLKLIVLRKGARSSLQYHARKHEHIYIDAGLAKMEFTGPEGELVTEIVGPGTILEHRPGDLHRVEALEDVRLFEVQTPYLDDVVRVEDDYKR